MHWGWCTSRAFIALDRSRISGIGSKACFTATNQIADAKDEHLLVFRCRDCSYINDIAKIESPMWSKLHSGFQKEEFSSWICIWHHLSAFQVSITYFFYTTLVGKLGKLLMLAIRYKRGTMSSGREKTAI